MQRLIWRNNLLGGTVLALGLVLGGGGFHGAHAQTLTQLAPLGFGRIVMHNNASARDLRLLPSGNYTLDPGYYVIDTLPQLGRYRIEGQTPNSIMSISITPVGSITQGGLNAFTLVDFFTVPAVVVTDPEGNATFDIGATLRSSGSGGNYLNGPYNGQFTVSVVPQ